MKSLPKFTNIQIANDAKVNLYKDTRPWLHLHIGTHKTGTTSIQNFLKKNRSLLRKQNFLYPCLPFRSNHKELGKALNIKNNKFNPQLALKIWEKYKTSHDNYIDTIISYEGFSMLGGGSKEVSKRKIHFLKKIFNPYRIHIILYIRKQDDWLPSFYNQRVKSRCNSQTWDEYLNRHLKAPLRLDRSIRFWEETIKAAKVSIRIYPAQSLVNGGIVEDFCDTIGIKLPPKIKLTKRKNNALSPKYLKIKRYANKLNPPNFVNKVLRILFEYLSSFDHERPQTRLTIEDRKKINDCYKQSNKKIAQKYFGRDQLFDIS